MNFFFFFFRFLPLFFLQIFFQMFKKIPSLQITEVSPVLHVGVTGASPKANSHATQPAEANYNINIADGPNWTSGGYVGCLGNTLKYNRGNNKSFYVAKAETCPVQWLGGTLVKKKKAVQSNRRPPPKRT